MRNVHTSCCSHLIKDREKSYDIIQLYDLLNHIKVPVEKSYENPISSVNTFHGRFSILIALLKPIKLKVYNCSHWYHGKSKVHSRSMIKIIIPPNYFIIFHCALVHCGSPSWYIESGVFHHNTR